MLLAQGRWIKVKRRLVSSQETSGAKGRVLFALWLFRRFQMTCALFEKHSESV